MERSPPDLASRLSSAAEAAKASIQPHPLPLVIEGLVKARILVSFVDSRVKILVITSDGDSVVTVPKEIQPYRAMVFIDCTEIEVFVTAKLLKASLIKCLNSKLDIRGGSVGPVEIAQCRGCTIRISSAIPLVQIDGTFESIVHQQIPEIHYIIHRSTNVSAVRSVGDVVDLSSRLFDVGQSHIHVGLEDEHRNSLTNPLNDVGINLLGGHVIGSPPKC